MRMEPAEPTDTTIDYMLAFGTNGFCWTAKRAQNGSFGQTRRSGYKSAIFEPLKPFSMKGPFGGFGGC